MNEDDKNKIGKLESDDNDNDNDDESPMNSGDEQELDEEDRDLKGGKDDNEDESDMVVDDVETKNYDQEEENEDEDEDEKDEIKKLSTENYTSTMRRKKQRYHTPKIFQDAITVLIPLDVTADLKIAIKKTRAKRITSLYKKFPSLLKETNVDNKINLKNDDEPMLDDEEEENAKEKDDKQPISKKNKTENVPQPNQFGSVLDYLEAKYVKGVMLEEDDEDGGPILDDKSEGQGSVYSRDSFLDDTDLQRDVAEQVMASTTLTKLELEHEDGDFFVNVGTLEVENDDYGDNYDPLLDKENKNKTTKKRKKSSSAASATSTKASTSGASTTSASKSKKTKTEQQQKKRPTTAKSTTTSKSKKSTGSIILTKSKKTDDKKTGDKPAKLVAKKAKSLSDALFKKATRMIRKLTSEELPRRTTKRKVALKCPKNKKPGDDITFENPHNPGQRLRVKVPKDCFTGGTFKVTVPVKHQKGEEDEKDRNKLSRELQECLDLFGKTYDEWCTAQSKVDSSFETFKEKQGKFIRLAKIFPSDLITPIDSDYLKQVVRRARQNKYKRSKTAAKNSIKQDEAERTEEDPKDDEDMDDDYNEEEEEEVDQPKPKKFKIVGIPTTGTNYPSKTWSAADFALNS